MRFQRAAVVLLLVVHAAVQVNLAWADSDTPDEASHLVAALSYTRRGTFRLCQVSPPLARLVQGAALLGTDLDASMIADPPVGVRVESRVGAAFRDANAEAYRTILWRARLGTVFFSVVGGLLVWRWGDHAFGAPCGLVALLVWCCDPMVLAHGHLVSPDVPAAALTLAAAWTFRGYLAAPSARSAAIAAAVLGLALLTKFTLVLLCGLWLLLWFGALSLDRPGVRPWHGVLVFAVALFTVNAGYLFQDTGRRLETFRFVSSKMAPFTPETIETVTGPTNALGGTWLGAFPVPLPAPLLEGIDLQSRDFDIYANRKTAFFMAGGWHAGGRYDYYLYGLLVKTPLAVFGLLAIGPIAARKELRTVDGLLLVAVPLAVLVFVSSQKSMNKHVRYVLPMAPFLAILCGATGRVFLTRRVGPRLLVGALLLWVLLAGWRATRDPIAYFNEAAG
ncbi:MAG: glycosyltransferase family 39 protein, partial [Gemmataceae bacterium]